MARSTSSLRSSRDTVTSAVQVRRHSSGTPAVRVPAYVAEPGPTRDRVPLVTRDRQRQLRSVGQGAGSGRGSDVIFKAVRDGRPYPEHGLSTRDWAKLPPRQVRLDELITTKRELELDRLLDEDSTFYGDLFPHAVQWEGDLYLEDGLHRALRAALQQRNSLHVRVLSLDGEEPAQA